MGAYSSYGLESGAYPPGAEFDPNAPWNQKDPPEIECRDCDGTGIDLDEGGECTFCKGEKWREMTADEMQEESDNELATREEQAELYYEMLREGRR